MKSIFKKIEKFSLPILLAIVTCFIGIWATQLIEVPISLKINEVYAKPQKFEIIDFEVINEKIMVTEPDETFFYIPTQFQIDFYPNQSYIWFNGQGSISKAFIAYKEIGKTDYTLTEMSPENYDVPELLGSLSGITPKRFIANIPLLISEGLLVTANEDRDFYLPWGQSFYFLFVDEFDGSIETYYYYYTSNGLITPLVNKDDFYSSYYVQNSKLLSKKDVLDLVKESKSESDIDRYKEIISDIEKISESLYLK